MSPGVVVGLDRDCELGTQGERGVVISVQGKYMVLVFPYRSYSREVRTGTDYEYLKVIP